MTRAIDKDGATYDRYRSEAGHSAQIEKGADVEGRFDSVFVDIVGVIHRPAKPGIGAVLGRGAGA